ncbi:hypothetical protein AV530_019160 [Patagioenas fasciata monilis]|uniref:Uncharacterized protein n=1 Tax=Patagioenas fasciata monilis TaxID=372326 RepID=A0A1V4KXE5_PATFA|nr:hypothetical protein AV530_019160 [Patagioenas fasciata monilis]
MQEVDNLESFGVGDSELEQKQVSKCFAKTELHLCCQVEADSKGDAAELRMLFGRVPDSDDDLLLLL